MLPDYPAVKREINRMLDRFLQQRVAKHLGFWGTVPRSQVFEGTRTYQQHSEEEGQETNFEEISASTSIAVSEIPTLTFEEILHRLDKSASQLAESMGRTSTAEMDRIVTAAGQVIDGKDIPTTETILRALEKIEITFDELGDPIWPTLMCHPDKEESLKKALELVRSDPAYRQRFDDVLQKQRERERAREASRSLVG
jgi:hypothetical protein